MSGSLNAPSRSGPDKPICMRIDAALAIMGIRKTKLYELIAAGEIEAIKIGRATLILHASIESYVARARRL